MKDLLISELIAIAKSERLLKELLGKKKANKLIKQAKKELNKRFEQYKFMLWKK